MLRNALKAATYGLMIAGIVGWLIAVIMVGGTEHVPGTPALTKHAHACWVEDKTDGTAERLCGDVSKAPATARNFSDRIPEEDEPAFDCKADGNQLCEPALPQGVLL